MKRMKDSVTIKMQLDFPKGATFNFGSWVCVTDVVGGFNCHLDASFGRPRGSDSANRPTKIGQSEPAQQSSLLPVGTNPERYSKGGENHLRHLLSADTRQRPTFQGSMGA